MNPTLFFLPLLAFFTGLIGTVISSTTGYEVASVISLSAALFFILLWVKLDFLAFKKLFSSHGAKQGMSSGMMIVLGLLLCVGVVFLSGRPTFQKQLDVTTLKLNTLSEQSIKIIENIKRDDKRIQMTAFFRSPQIESNFRLIFDLYLQQGLPIDTEYLDIQAEPMRAMQEQVTSANMVIFRFNENESRITTFNEEKITNALIKVLKGQTKKVYFLSGHGEGNIDNDSNPGFSFVARMLKNDNYEVETLSLTETMEIPDDAKLIILAGNKYDLNAHEADLLEVYVKTGGGLLMALDAVTNIPIAINLAEKFGVRVNEDLILLAPDDKRVQHYKQNNAFITDFEDFHVITKDFARQSQTDLIMPFTRSVEVQDTKNPKVKSEVIAKASDQMIKIKGVRAANDLGDIVEGRIDTGTFPVMVASTIDLRENNIAKNTKETSEAKRDGVLPQSPLVKEARVVVVGSASFMKNQIVQSSVVSQDLLMNIVNYILQDEDYISIRPKEFSRSTVSVTTTESQVAILFLCVVYPLLFLAMGAYFWMRRRNA